MNVRTRRAAALVLAFVVALGAYLYRASPREEEDPLPADVADKRAHVRARLELDTARQALRRGDLAAATQLAEAALALDDDMADAMRLLAVVHKRAGRDAEACRHMRDYVQRAATPEPARARLLESACADASSDAGAR